MAGRFVRASKYRESLPDPVRRLSSRHRTRPGPHPGAGRDTNDWHSQAVIDQLLTPSPTGHVFGKSTRKEFCYDNLHISRNAWDTNLVKVRPLPRPSPIEAVASNSDTNPSSRPTPTISP